MTDDNIDVDGMLFLAAIIEDQIEMLDASAGLATIPGGEAVYEGVAQICRDQIEMAQAQLDTIIAKDTTWRPA